MDKDIRSVDANKFYQIGLEYFKRGDYEKARENFSKVLVLNSVMSDAYFYRALSSYFLKDYDSAYRDYTRALELDPKNPVIYNNRGDILFKKGQINDAIKDYDKAIVFDPNYARAYHNRGICYLSLEKYDKALEDFNKVIELEPNNPDAYYLRGVCYENLNDFDKAAKDYQRAYELDPELQDAKDRLEGLEIKRAGSGGQQQGGSSDVKILKDIKINFKDLAGMEKLKNELMNSIVKPLQYAQLTKEYGLMGGGGILMYGPPGCGKTYFVKAAAGEAKVAFINVKLSDILDMYVGNTEKNIHKVFEAARKNAPAILFFDEVDAIGARRDSGGGEAGQALRSAINQFLTEMDGIEANNENVLVIAATNAPWDVDPALRRSGRFSRTIYVPPPDFQTRVKMLKIHAKGRPISKNIAWMRLGLLTIGYSAADIKALSDKAAQYAWLDAIGGKKREIRTSDYIRASDEVKSSLGPWYAQARKKLGRKKEVMYIDGKKHEKEIESDLGEEERQQFRDLIQVVEKNNKWYYKIYVEGTRFIGKYLPIPI
ncbi:MAG: tetratricopeptide repeat protein [Candidatus Anstonellales archaeon]